MRPFLFGGVAAAALCLASMSVIPAQAEVMTMKADLKGSSEVPPNASTASGMLQVTYDTATKGLTWSGTYTGLSGPATAAHFHGPAEAGKNAPVLVPSPAPSPIKGSATLTDAQATDLAAGRMYFNVHTAANPGGEIRGQVVK